MPGERSDEQHAFNTRRAVLEIAQRSWGEPGGAHTVSQHAKYVTFLAKAFHGFLVAGVVHGEDAPEPAADTATSTPGDRLHAAAVLTAALAWVNRSHTNNRSGPENWRNWADDHDIDLINAVLAYRGQEPLERTTP